MAHTSTLYPAVPEARTASLLRNTGIAIAATAVMALCAHAALPLPWTPIPLTLNPLPVLLVGLLLGPRLGFATALLYLAEGAAGLPVFAPSATIGFAHLVGPTGGFLLSYPFVAAIAGAIFAARRTFPAAILAGFAASVVLFTMGAGWLAVLTHASLNVVLAQAVVPFIAGDILKVIAAAGIATGWNRLRTR